MHDRRPVEELSIDELEEILAIRKREAREAKAREGRERGSKEYQQAAFRSEAQAALVRLYTYLRELVDNLNAVRPDVSVSYRVEGYGEFTGLRQSEYRLLADDPSAIALSFVCSKDQKVTFPREGRPNIQRQWDYMASHGLRFAFEEARRHTVGKTYQGSFRLECRVPVTLSFAVDLEALRIRFTARNLDFLGEQVYSLKPDVIGGEFFEALAQAVVRKPNRLNQARGRGQAAGDGPPG